jgi:hypothetical protein
MNPITALAGLAMLGATLIPSEKYWILFVTRGKKNKVHADQSRVFTDEAAARSACERKRSCIGIGRLMVSAGGTRRSARLSKRFRRTY